MVHRLGRIGIGETSVAVVVTAPHRKPAFDAALEGINRLKRSWCPIWKKEYFVDGEVWVDGEWDDVVVKLERNIHEISIMRWLAAGALATLHAQTSRPSRSSALVRLLVNVRDPAGDWSDRFERDEFTIFDCGVPQDISFFER